MAVPMSIVSSVPPVLDPSDAHWAAQIAAQLAFEHRHHAALIRSGGAGTRRQAANCLVRIRSLEADLARLERKL